MTRSRRWLVLGCWLWALAALIPATDAGWASGWLCFLFPVGVGLFGCWLWASRRSADSSKDWCARSLMLSGPAAMALVLVLGMTNLGLSCRLWLCERELQEFAETMREGNIGAGPPLRYHHKRVGLFYVYQTGGLDTEVHLITAHRPAASHGLLYCPDGNGYGYEHIYGPWYRYFDDW